jgi:hypothetical protein
MLFILQDDRGYTLLVCLHFLGGCLLQPDWSFIAGSENRRPEDEEQ